MFFDLTRKKKILFQEMVGEVWGVEAGATPCPPFSTALRWNISFKNAFQKYLEYVTLILHNYKKLKMTKIVGLKTS